MIASYTWAKSLDNSSGWFNAENGTGGGSIVQTFFDPRNAYQTLPTIFATTSAGARSTHFHSDAGSGGAEGLGFIHHWRMESELSVSDSIRPALQPECWRRRREHLRKQWINHGYSRPNVISNPLQGSCGSTPIGKRGPNGFCEYNPASFAIPSGSFGNMGKCPTGRLLTTIWIFR
jgi:hypothetical protein